MVITNSGHLSNLPSWVPQPAHRLFCWVKGLDLATRQIRNRLGGVNDFTQEIFFAGDGIQRAAIDSFFDFLTPERWTAERFLELSSNAVSESLQVARFLTPGQTGYLSWLELQNKLEVFLLVQTLPSILNLPSDRMEPLPELVRRAYMLPTFAVLWALEGLGHYYAEMSWKEGKALLNLFSEFRAPVPDKSLLMLHAGMGLSFAYRLLSGLTRESPVSAVQETVDCFAALCRENSRNGYVGAAIESLGLVTRDFYPELMRPVSQALDANHPDLSSFFWHGAGRALYFSRAHFIPWLRTPWSSIQEEGASEMERLNLAAGLAWALTLVNMRHPRIVEGALSSSVLPELYDAFANGIGSCIVVRQEITPDAEFLFRFCSGRPASQGCNESTLWGSLVVGPCEAALRSIPGLKEKHLLDQVFRFGADLT